MVSSFALPENVKERGSFLTNYNFQSIIAPCRFNIKQILLELNKNFHESRYFLRTNQKFYVLLRVDKFMTKGYSDAPF